MEASFIGNLSNTEPVSWEEAFVYFYSNEKFKFLALENGLEQIEFIKSEKYENNQWVKGTIPIEQLVDIQIQRYAIWIKQLSCPHRIYECEVCKNEKRTFLDFYKFHKYHIVGSQFASKLWSINDQKV